MGIYLPNMEMPRKGQMLVIFPDGTSYVCFNGMRERLTQTTAVPVPPHGRLIDENSVLLQIDEWIDSVGTVMIGHGLSYYGELLGCIEDAPTIIPADKEREA